MPGETEEPRSPEQQDQEGGPAAAANAASEELRPRAAAAAAAPPAETASSRVLRGGRDRGRTAAAAAAAAVVSRRRKAEYPRRRRSSPSNRPPDGPGHQPAAAKPPSPAQGKKSPRLQCIEKITTDKDPKEEKEDDSILPQEVSITTTRPSRSWRSSSRTSISRLRDTENTRSSRSKTGSLQLVCKTEPITDQLDYDVPEEHQSPGGISSDEEEEEEEEMLISEEEIPFKDDPRDETYKPHLERETPKPRRKSGKVKEEKEKRNV